MTVESLAAKRWTKSSSARDFTPRDVLVECIRQIDAGELECDHLVIVHVHEDANEETEVGLMQAGPHSCLSVVGMLHRATQLAVGLIQ